MTCTVIDRLLATPSGDGPNSLRTAASHTIDCDKSATTRTITKAIWMTMPGSEPGKPGFISLGVVGIILDGDNSNPYINSYNKLNAFAKA